MSRGWRFRGGSIVPVRPPSWVLNPLATFLVRRPRPHALATQAPPLGAPAQALAYACGIPSSTCPPPFPTPNLCHPPIAPSSAYPLPSVQHPKRGKHAKEVAIPQKPIIPPPTCGRPVRVHSFPEKEQETITQASSIKQPAAGSSSPRRRSALDTSAQPSFPHPPAAIPPNPPLQGRRASDSRKRGGQPGNQNARTHGFYSSSLTPQDQRRLTQAGGIEDLEPEITLIRLKILTILETPEAPPTLFFKAMGALLRLINTQHRISRNRPRQPSAPTPATPPDPYLQRMAAQIARN